MSPCAPILSLWRGNTPLVPACACWLAALGEGGHLPISGCLVTWSAPATYAIPDHGLCLGGINNFPCPSLTSRTAGLVQSAGGLWSPRAVGVWNGLSPSPSCSVHVPCSLQPLGHRKRLSQLRWCAKAQPCLQTCPQNPPICFWKRGRVGWPPTLSATKTLPLHGPHPTLCPPEPLSSLSHPWTWEISDTAHPKPRPRNSAQLSGSKSTDLSLNSSFPTP